MRLSFLFWSPILCGIGTLLLTDCTLNDPRLERSADAGDAGGDAPVRADAADATTDVDTLNDASGDADASLDVDASVDASTDARADAAADARADAKADAADAGPCDPVTGGGCGSGQKCGWIIDQTTPIVRGHTGCMPLRGTKTLHNECNSNADDCAAGYDCSGECSKVCRLNRDCPASHICAITNAFTDRPGVGVCFEVCNPVLPNDCTETGDACYWFGSVGTCVRAGSRTGDCTSLGSFECARGTECVPTSASTLECRPFCDPVVATSCPSPQVCRTFAQLFQDSSYADDFGVCMAP
jgi:hypothetical protein